MNKKILFTIGHSNRPLSYFLDLLRSFDIERVIDVRTIPHSRHNPQFDQQALKEELREVKIAYTHLKELGGLRHPRKDSLNTAWENAGFRGFADYMQTEPFEKGLEKLMKAAEKQNCAIVCAEAVPWRCHRSLIADALTVKKWKVFHIQSRKTAKLHVLTPFLQKKKGKIIYA